MLRILVMNISAFVNPCVFSDLPLKQGFFIPVITQLVRRCREHSRIWIPNIKLLGVGEFLRAKEQKAVDYKWNVNRAFILLPTKKINSITDFQKQLPF